MTAAEGELHCWLSTALGPQFHLAISEAEFRVIERANIGLKSALTIEETYDILIGNYVAYEKFVIGAAVDYAVRSSREQFQPLHRECNRVVANLLSSARAFIDGSNKRVCTLFERNSPQAAKVKAAFSSQFDSLQGYRIMEALRNHSQHAGHAISTVAVGGHHGFTMAERTPPLLIVYARHLIYPHELRQNSNFNARALRELELLNPPNLTGVEATPLVRDYMIGLSNSMMVIRNELDPVIAGWKRDLAEVVAKYKSAVTDFCSDQLLHAYCRSGGQLEEEYVSVSPFPSLGQLREVNKDLNHLGRVQFHH